jgi:hypothetical protein
MLRMPPLMEPDGQLGFLILLADSLGLYFANLKVLLIHRPEDTLCTAMVFIHRYQRWNDAEPDKSMSLDPHV